MSKWTEKTLGDISKTITGPFGTQLHKSDYKSSGIAVIMPQNIGDRTISYEKIAYISEEDAKRLKRYVVHQNDIVYARRGDVEKHAFISENEDGELCGTGCFLVHFESEEVIPEFISYYLNTPQIKKWILKNAVGSNMPNLNTGILKKVPVKFPDIIIQKRIVKTMSLISNKILTNREINDNLDQMAYKTYMHLYFGKKPNGKVSDILVENSKSKIQVGDAKGIKGNYPFFTSGDTILEWDDYLVSGRNCYLNTGGNAGVKFYVGKSSYSTDTWCITAKNGMEDYLFLMLKSIIPELNIKFFQGTGLKHLQKPLLKNRKIYIPSEQEIEFFNKKIQPMFNLIASNTRENQNLMDLRDWLLPLLMNGQAIVEN
ncbi:restriction endonuclease subunit S [Sporolactobacillus laevolacticus]|uniref:restriction endonuclease subunit S n=1 Tax=Sporolactobacillus laevolacticus TaxID=33018 RepID=UPI0025B4A69A|nr:restriction endonuclease subunit S [Sporolactobacillus laevolacticus]MDN3956174.1 restriction endonuclease subunit S [Sporolactobacillus laevolacticus]